MEAEELPEEAEGILEFTTREEYITCACNALNSTESIDAMTAADKARLNRIRRKCLLILDELVNEMFAELFESEEE
jgi:hypothetical protein